MADGARNPALVTADTGAPRCWRCNREGFTLVRDPMVADGIRICERCAGERDDFLTNHPQHSQAKQGGTK